MILPGRVRGDPQVKGGAQRRRAATPVGALGLGGADPHDPLGGWTRTGGDESKQNDGPVSAPMVAALDFPGVLITGTSYTSEILTVTLRSVLCRRLAAPPTPLSVMASSPGRAPFKVATELGGSEVLDAPRSGVVVVWPDVGERPTASTDLQLDQHVPRIFERV